MSSIKVQVQDANNITLLVTPQPRINVVIDRGASGPQGPMGPTGPQGTGLIFLGTVATVNDLPQTGNQQGDAYVVQSNGHVYAWNN
jgi:hypothetical protein